MRCVRTSVVEVPNSQIQRLLGRGSEKTAHFFPGSSCGVTCYLLAHTRKVCSRKQSLPGHLPFVVRLAPFTHRPV